MTETRQALILGGAGDVGEGIVRQFRKRGWATIVPSRTKERLDPVALSTRGAGQFLPFIGDIGSEEGSKEAAEEIAARYGRFDIVVAAIGGWWAGPSLLKMTTDDWYRVLENSLSSHFHAARAFLPRVVENPSGQYVFINGGASRMPVPGSGPISVAAAAQEMLQRVFAAECEHLPGTVYTLVLNSLVITRSRPDAPAGSLTADQVGGHVLALQETPPKSGASIIIPDQAGK